MDVDHLGGGWDRLARIDRRASPPGRCPPSNFHLSLARTSPQSKSRLMMKPSVMPLSVIGGHGAVAEPAGLVVVGAAFPAARLEGAVGVANDAAAAASSDTRPHNPDQRHDTTPRSLCAIQPHRLVAGYVESGASFFMRCSGHDDLGCRHRTGVDLLEKCGQGDLHIGALLQHHDGVVCGPAAFHRTGERLRPRAPDRKAGRENEIERGDRCRLPSLVASRRQILVTPVSSSASTLRRMAPRASAASSTNRQKRAPRDRASSPSAPEPANRSSTRAPSKSKRGAPCSSTLNSAWRTRSDGRPCGEPFRRLDARASEFAGYDAHGRAKLIERARRVAFRPRCRAPARRRASRPSWSRSTRGFTSLDRAGREIAERERSERDADQPVDGEAEMLGEPLHLAVLAFA